MLRLLDGDECGHEKAPLTRFGRIQFPSKVGDFGGCCAWRMASPSADPHFARCFLITELMGGQGRRFRVGRSFIRVMVRRPSEFYRLGWLASGGGKSPTTAMVMMLFCSACLSFGFGSGWWRVFCVPEMT